MLAVSHAGLLAKNEIFDAEYIKAPPNDQAGGTLRNVPHVEIFDAYWLLATLREGFHLRPARCRTRVHDRLGCVLWILCCVCAHRMYCLSGRTCCC